MTIKNRPQIALRSFGNSMTRTVISLKVHLQSKIPISSGFLILKNLKCYLTKIKSVIVADHDEIVNLKIVTE